MNAVTPMTHLFMDIKNEPEINNMSLRIPQTDVVVNVTRTGKAVTLVNLSSVEPDCFSCFQRIISIYVHSESQTSSSETRKQGN